MSNSSDTDVQEASIIITSPRPSAKAASESGKDENDEVELVLNSSRDCGDIEAADSAASPPSPPTLKSGDKKRLRVLAALLGIAIAIAIIVIIAVFASRSNKAPAKPDPVNNSTTSTPAPTTSPTVSMAPSSSPSHTPTAEFEDFAKIARIVSVEVFGLCAESANSCDSDDERNALTWFNDESNHPDDLTLKKEILKERLSLAVLFQATGGESWLETTNHCSWFLQITCDLDRVKKIDLENNDMAAGTLHPVIGQFELLETLILKENSLTGLPTEIGNLVNLKKLDVSMNGISVLPTEIGQLVNLENVDISSNALAGAIPSEIGDLQKLQSLDIGENTDLKGNIPAEVCQIESLTELNADCDVCRNEDTPLDCCTSTNCDE